MFRSVLVTLTKSPVHARAHLILRHDLHLSSISYSPRFDSTPNASPTESQTKLSHDEDHQELSSKPQLDADLAAWNEVEREMYHQKRSPLVKVPMSDFKKLRREQFKAKVTNIPIFDMKQIDRESIQGVSPAFKKQMKKKSTLIPPEVIKDPEIGEYLKLERDDPLIDDVFLTISSKKHQDRKQLLPLEGRRLVQDALKVGLNLKFLIFSKIEQVKLIAEDLRNSSTKAKLLKVSNHNIKFWSQLNTAPGVIGIFERPLDMNSLIEQTRPNQLPLSMICDNIREPNNLGALIRVATAAGLDQIILTKGCTSPWDSKALRGSAGTVFRTKILGPVDWTQVPHFFPYGMELFIADNNFGRDHMVNYDMVEFSSPVDLPKAVIVGGESHGISEEAKDLLMENLKLGFGGGVINVPLANDVESLNVASAAAVVLFELRRKLLFMDATLLENSNE